jgi:hypothetical protein
MPTANTKKTKSPLKKLFLKVPPKKIIIASAIRLPDGTCFSWKYHGDCFAQLATFSPEIWKVVSSNAEQGFLTNTLEFVDRKEGARIAYISRQIRQYVAELHSEDIFIGNASAHI